MKKLLFILIPVLSLTTSWAQNTATTFHNPTALPKPNGYSTTVRIDLGSSTLVIVSGLVAFDKDRNVIGEGDLEKQTKLIFTNLKLIAEDAGGSMNDVVKLGIFLTDISQLQTLRNVRDQFINKAQPPASTTVEVSNLVKKGLLAEIEATLVIPKH